MIFFGSSRSRFCNSIALGLLAMAAVLLGFLTWSSSKALIPGCEANANCSSVLSSRWSSLFGGPVGLFDGLIYGGGILSATVPRLRKFFPGVGQELGLTFTNTGEQTAVMKGLQVPLYWRVVQTPPQEVAPGESAAVRFIIATIPLENGPWEKEIALISNSEPAKATFTIAANVRELTAVEQPNISRAHCNYRFENLTVGTYAVAFSDVGGYWQSLGSRGNDSESNTDPLAFALISVDNKVSGFGYDLNQTCVGNYVWADTNHPSHSRAPRAASDLSCRSFNDRTRIGRRNLLVVGITVDPARPGSLREHWLPSPILCPYAYPRL